MGFIILMQLEESYYRLFNFIMVLKVFYYITYLYLPWQPLGLVFA